MNAASPSAFAAPLARASAPVRAAAALAGSLFIAAAAQIVVPFVPVPMTMQTFAVLTVGLMFGARLGALTVGLYLLEGLVGLPVFAGAGNILTVLAKPTTAGYLVGFLAMASVAGAVAARGRGSLVRQSLAVVAGEAALYACGVPALAALIGWDKAVAFGLVPFLLGDAVKATLAVAVSVGASRLFVGRFGR